MMTRGGEGVSIPPKNDDVIYEQPLILQHVSCVGILILEVGGECAYDSISDVPES